MKRLIEPILFILFLVFFSCEKKITEEEFEQNVFDKLFITIVDSTYKDQRLYNCFPKHGKSIYDNNGKWIGLDSVGQHKRDLECEVKRTFLEKDSLNLVIALENRGLINKKTDLRKYKSSKFVFKHLSKQPKGTDLEYTNWKTENKFAGVMSFSRIIFDAKKESGSLDVSYKCGGKCGLGYSIYIQKVKNKWVIFKVEEIWIS